MKILFVCLGNTCRSPMAESIMKQKIDQNKLDWIVDSAALRTWNIGRKPADRCLQVLAENHLSSEHLCRVITNDDFYEFDYILGMDDANLKELKELRTKVAAADKTEQRMATTQLLGSYIGRFEDEIISDPYFCKDVSAFRHVFVQISEGCHNFIKQHSK